MLTRLWIVEGLRPESERNAKPGALRQAFPDARRDPRAKDARDSAR